jgi:hypothetical protein
MKIPGTCPLALGVRMKFLPLTEHYPTDNLGQVKVSQQTDAEKCDNSIMMMMIVITKTLTKFNT